AGQLRADSRTKEVTIGAVVIQIVQAAVTSITNTEFTQVEVSVTTAQDQVGCIIQRTVPAQTQVQFLGRGAAGDYQASVVPVGNIAISICVISKHKEAVIYSEGSADTPAIAIVQIADTIADAATFFISVDVQSYV